MKKIKCIKPPITCKNISKGKEYEVLGIIENDKFIISNDIGKIVTYSQNLFNIVESESNYEEMNIEDFILEYLSINSFIEDFTSIIRVNSTKISCGILQVFAINDAFEALSIRLEAALEELNISISEEYFYNICTKIAETALFHRNDIITDKKLIYLFSTNESINSYFTCIDKVLSDSAQFTYKGVNPVSENVIKFWVITTDVEV